MGKRVLVTGGAGLIGSHLVDLLLNKGHQVKILDNLDPQTHPNGRPSWIPSDAEFIQGDIRSDVDVKQALQQVDWVFHQAAFGGFTTALTQYMDVNATGTARIFEVIRDYQLTIEKIVVASSQAIYGEGLYHCPSHRGVMTPMRSLSQLQAGQWESQCPLCYQDLTPGLTPENGSVQGETIYAISKLAEEKLALGLGKLLNIPTVALRYAVTYGPRQSIFNPYTGVVSIFSTQLLNNKAPVIYEDGLQTRDFLYVEDNAKANLFVMEHPDTAYEVYNVGTGQPVSILHLVDTLANLYGIDIKPSLPGSFRPGDVRHFVHDVSKLNALGWQPQIALKEGLTRYIAWIQEQGNIANYFDVAYAKLQKQQVVIERQAASMKAP